MLITNMVEFCQNYRLIDQKSMDKLSILSYFSHYGKQLAYEDSMMVIMNMTEFARINDRLIRNRLINYQFCHFSAAAMVSIDIFSMMLIMNMVEFARFID